MRGAGERASGRAGERAREQAIGRAGGRCRSREGFALVGVLGPWCFSWAVPFALVGLPLWCGALVVCRCGAAVWLLAVGVGSGGRRGFGRALRAVKHV